MHAPWCFVIILEILNEQTGEIDMKNTMEYKNYIGSVEFSEADELFFGKVLGIRSLVSYEGWNVYLVILIFNFVFLT